MFSHQTGLISAVALILTMNSCDSVIKPDEVGSLPEQIELDSYAQTNSSGEYLLLHCRGGDYNYSNVHIITDITLEENIFVIEFLGTECLGPCLEASYENDRPGTGYVQFPVLATGDYPIKFRRPNGSSGGTLHVSEYEFKLEINLPNGLYFNTGGNVIGRIPENLLWGTFFHINDPIQLTSLINQLSVSGQFEQAILPANNYGAFSFSENGEFYATDEYNSDTSICVYYNGNTDALQSTFDTWFETYNGSYPSVHLYDGLGNVLWLP